MTLEERKNTFLERANQIHDTQYDYSRLVYVNSSTKVEIVCKIHGVFFQTPNKHISRRQGCPKCGVEKSRVKRTKPFSQFVNQATDIHLGFYDYSLSKEHYKGAFTKIPIICPEHGIFHQTPDNHINDRKGCYFCGVERNRRKFTMTQEEFLRRSIEVHGDRYDYSKTEYKNDKTKVTIICKKHGDWNQYPGSHIRGFGCQKCGFDSTAIKNGMSKDDFIRKAEETHGVDTYDYSKVVFKNSKTKVIIICPEHGEFEQEPTSHMLSSGCPKCYVSSGERQIRLFLERNHIEFVEQMKFKECKLELSLPFDFYLRDYNLLIEFDGRQHFKAIEYFGGETEFKKRQVRDKIKNQYAKSQNVKLLRISYKEQNNIEEILEKEITCPNMR